MQSGLSLSEVSRRTGVSRAALKEWRRTGGARATRASTANPDCMRCDSAARSPTTGPAYAYLLGQYLGDGCLGAFPRGVWSLRIACGDAWPGVKEECISAIKAVHPRGKVFEVRDQGCVQVTSLWKHWLCHFPQHGRGRKHERTIALEPWQHDIVVEHTGRFLRGLFHSDGCRFTNRVAYRNRDGVLRREYAYPRYSFDNRSSDILTLCGSALDRLGIPWRYAKPTTISVARREAVAALDRIVGPKY
jgi:hypothetical protein